MQKVVLSGGPSTGKSTTFEALKGVYSEAYFVEEAAEIVIKKELQKQKADPDYAPVMPLTDHRKFAALVIDQQISAEAKIPDDKELAILDRSIIDNLGYLAYNGITDMMTKVDRYVKTAGYTLAFFCDWLDKFEQTEIRRESAEEGLAIHRHLEAAYHTSDIPVIHLPPVTVEERLAIIKTTLAG